MDVCNGNSLSLLTQHRIHQAFFLFRLLLWGSRCGGSHWTEPFCMGVTGKGSFVFPEEPPQWVLWASLARHFPFGWPAKNTAQPETSGVVHVQNDFIAEQSSSSTRSSTWERSLPYEVWTGPPLWRAATWICPKRFLPVGSLGRTFLSAQDMPNNRLLTPRKGQMKCQHLGWVLKDKTSSHKERM